jgi:pimeloyl-ACP methyl ester carboxylesterase
MVRAGAGEPRIIEGSRPGAAMQVLVPRHRARAGALDVAYVDAGPPHGPPVVLLHGFPYSIQAYAQVVPILVEAGCHVLVPELRGYGATRFRDASTPRSGEQAALGADLLALLDALALPRAVLAGYDWGGRAACVVAALWPQRCAGLVSCGGYNIHDIAAAVHPEAPEQEHRYWYQYYFHGERGRAGLDAHRRALGRLLWSLWSPTWRFDDETFGHTALAFDNPDFVDVVVHSYRHRYGLVPGDPAVATLQAQLATQPPITVPAITLDGADDGVRPPGDVRLHAHRFGGPREHRVLDGVGHNVPQEAPAAFAAAVLELVRRRDEGTR